MPKTLVDIDDDLLRGAAAILGTATKKDTVARALAEVIRRERLRKLAATSFPDLTPEGVAARRRGRR